jgi:hypothetical protein
VADEQRAVELIGAEFEEDFGMAALAFDKGFAGRQRLNGPDFMLQFQSVGDHFGGLAGPQQRASQNQIEFHPGFAQPYGGQFHFLAPFGSERPVSVFDHTGLTEVGGDSMTHQVKFNQSVSS